MLSVVHDVRARPAAGRDRVPLAKVRLDPPGARSMVTAGPFSVKAMPPGMKHEEMDMMEDHNTPADPVRVAGRGVVPRLCHRDRGRRPAKPIDRPTGAPPHRHQFRPAPALLSDPTSGSSASAQETEDACIPKSIGIPMKPATKLGMYLAWANESGKDWRACRSCSGCPTARTNLNPRPLDGASNLHGRESHRRQGERLRHPRADGARRPGNSPRRWAAGSWAWAATCTTTASRSGWKTPSGQGAHHRSAPSGSPTARC